MDFLMYSEAYILRSLQFFVARDLLSSELHDSTSPMFQRFNGLKIYHMKPIKLN